jgi:4-hydroxy-tetrahydrodipicolinate synthase
MSKGNFEGVLVPVPTPFTASFKPDAKRFIEICKWTLEQGASGLAVLGTTSEANSMSLSQRCELLDQLIEAGVPAIKLMPGAGACSLDETITMTRKATQAGCGGVLLLPPFYYKIATDDGVFKFISEVVQQVGSSDLQVYLYHIPPMAVIPYSIDLVGRLIKAYPDTIVGIKDSSGDWSNTEALLREYPDFDVFPGSELFLLQGLRAGSSGCITATGSVNPAGICAVFDNWQTGEADALQSGITEIRKTIQAYPMIAAVKTIIAHFNEDPDWKTVAPPLLPLADNVAKSLLSDLTAINFEMAKLTND